MLIFSVMITAGEEIWLKFSSIIHVKTSYVYITATFSHSFSSFLLKNAKFCFVVVKVKSLCLTDFPSFFCRLNFSRLRREDE